MVIRAYVNGTDDRDGNSRATRFERKHKHEVDSTSTGEIPASNIGSYRNNTDTEARIESAEQTESRDNTRNHATISAVIFETKGINKELPSRGRS